MDSSGVSNAQRHSQRRSCVDMSVIVASIHDSTLRKSKSTGTINSSTHAVYGSADALDDSNQTLEGVEPALNLDLIGGTEFASSTHSTFPNLKARPSTAADKQRTRKRAQVRTKLGRANATESYCDRERVSGRQMA